MKKSIVLALLALCIVAIATPVFAADGGADGGGSWKVGLAALGLGIAAAGCGIGQGRAAADALGGIARNPGATGRIQPAMLLALAFMESLTIFAWVMVLILNNG